RPECVFVPLAGLDRTVRFHVALVTMATIVHNIVPHVIQGSVAQQQACVFVRIKIALVSVLLVTMVIPVRIDVSVSMVTVDLQGIVCVTKDGKAAGVTVLVLT
ncbi:uncharacterized protein LOC134237752, partial [Saccostrea cucullata]|uniref:uncharacterized protein LOC134237752 n=1 Tax=Saccostrea cuccullata TaxID=36930 RepID=UPI002ED2C31E